MNLKKIEKFTNAFKTQFPNAWIKVGDFYGDGKTTVWSGENAFDNDGLELFSYYNNGEGVYANGDVHCDLEELTAKHGFYWECYDAGTYMLIED